MGKRGRGGAARAAGGSRGRRPRPRGAGGSPTPRRRHRALRCSSRRPPLRRASAGDDALYAKLSIKDPRVARFVADGVAHVRCRATLAEALATRGSLAVGESFVTPQGHLVSATGVGLFAPDSEIHGVIARQREIDRLRRRIAGRAGGRRAPRASRSTPPRARSMRSSATITTRASPSPRSSGACTTSISSWSSGARKPRRGRCARASSPASATRWRRRSPPSMRARDAVLREIADLQSARHERATQRAALARRARRARRGRRARARARARGRARGAGGGIRRAQRARAHRRSGAPRRGRRAADGAPARAARTPGRRARVDRLDAGRGSAAARARGARGSRAGAGGGTRRARSAGRAAARCGGGAHGRRAQARAGARAHPGNAAQGTGGAARRAAVHASSSPKRRPISPRCRPSSRRGAAIR